MTDKLRFTARGTACVPDPHGTEASPQRRRMVGRKHEQIKPGTWAWVPLAKPDELAFHQDLAKAVKDGDLWPADEATAKACGVKFDPMFGVEKPANQDKKSGPAGKEQV